MIHGNDIAPRQERHPVRALQLALGAQLRELLEPVVDEPLPADLAAQLAQLDGTRPARR